MSDFEKLMGELDQLSTEQGELVKALPADDGKDEKKIQAAAEDGGLGGGDGDGDDKGGKPDGDADDKGDKPMTKSFKLTLEDGTEIEAQDGAEMVKSLTERVETAESNMTKALGAAINLIKGQGDMIKSLGEQIKKLSGEGRGRKAVLSVVEKPDPGTTMAKSHQPDGVSHEQFFAKALAAQREGRISGTDIALAETCLNRGQEIPAAIVQRVMS